MIEWSQQIVKRFSEKTNDLVRLQNIMSAWYSLEFYAPVIQRFSATQEKQMDDDTSFDLQLPWLEANWV